MKHARLHLLRIGPAMTINHSNCTVWTEDSPTNYRMDMFNIPNCLLDFNRGTVECEAGEPLADGEKYWVKVVAKDAGMYAFLVRATSLEFPYEDETEDA